MTDSALDSLVVRHVATSIAPASAAAAAAARARVARALDSVEPDTTIERLAALLGGAQHTSRPQAKPRFVMVVAGDRGCDVRADAEAPMHPTTLAARAIAAGTAPLARVARTTETSVVLVNAGACEPNQFPSSAIATGGTPSNDWTIGPAMTLDNAYRALEAGIALAVSLSEQHLAVLAVGAIGTGAESAAEAMLAALRDPTAPAGTELLVRFGGPHTGVLAGVILGAASMNIPVIIDGYETGAAALVAAAIAPDAVGYLIASHRGSGAMTGILTHLHLDPLFEVGLGRGDGTGAAIALPFVDQVASLAQDG